MRSEQEMFELIMDTAKGDERIRAVILNGSRANPNIQRDIFQDFDIVYLVTEIAPFKNARQWIKRFGELMILQTPDVMGEPSADEKWGFTYLMQFMDGNRIDLTVFPISKINEREKDSLSVLLLDKDGIVEPFAPANDSDYLPKPPTSKAFADCCNEFWWVSAYVAKGLWREELPYAKGMLDEYVRNELMKVLTWYIGLKTHFLSNPGKKGKYFKQFLEPELWELLENTYSDAGYEHTWEALFAMAELFRKAAIVIAEQFGFDYPYGDDERVHTFLKHVRRLPKDAKEVL